MNKVTSIKDILSRKTQSPLSEDLLRRMASQMFLIRGFEDKLEGLFKEGLLFGTIHSCSGQEASAVGVANAIERTDIVTGNHRSHGHYIAHCEDILGLMSEIMGKETGVVGGIGGSQHLYNKSFISNGVQGCMTPVAAGMAMAEKRKGSGKIVISFIGDGTLGQGVLYESLNMASLWDLPIVYVVENNMYAMSTHVEHAVAGSIIDRAKAFNIDSEEITSNDVVDIYLLAKEIQSYVRKNCRPFFLNINTYRLSGHSKSDDRSYRTKEEESSWHSNDPLKLIAKYLPTTLIEKLEADSKEQIDKYFKQASEAKVPRLQFE